MKACYFLLGGSMFLLLGCSSTHTVATWKSPNFEAKPYKKLLVWGMSDNVSVRATVEDDMAYFLNLKGIASVSGSDIAPPDRKALPKKMEDAKAILEKNGFDCVMTMGLINKKEKTRYVQGSGNYTPVAYGYYGSYYGSFYSYYPYMYGNVYQPGHYEASQELYIETNIWDVKSGKLVWSQQSKTVDPGSVEKFANSYTRGTVNALIKEGILVHSK